MTTLGEQEHQMSNERTDDGSKCFHCGRGPEDGATLTLNANEVTRCERHPYGLPEMPRIVSDDAIVIPRGVAMSLAGPLRMEAGRTDRPGWGALLDSLADILEGRVSS